jgi:simple sugar transport system substrate-binding protein
VLQGINAFTLGMRSVNPKAQVRVVWTSSWFDPGKERAGADTLIAGGADIITQHTDSTAIAQAGEEKGVMTIADNSDQSKYGPKTCLTAVTHNWAEYYVGRVKAAIGGTWKSGDVWRRHQGRHDQARPLQRRGAGGCAQGSGSRHDRHRQRLAQGLRRPDR